MSCRTCLRKKEYISDKVFYCEKINYNVWDCLWGEICDYELKPIEPEPIKVYNAETRMAEWYFENGDMLSMKIDDVYRGEI